MGITLCALVLAGTTDAQTSDSTAIPPPRSAGPAADVVERELTGTGLENVSVELGDRASIGFENRAYRHAIVPLDLARRFAHWDAPGDLTIWVRRHGLDAAAIPAGPGEPWSRVIHPSDASYPAPPQGPIASPSTRRLDLILRPLVTYELGRVYDPLLLRLELAPELRYNPWTGARMRAAVIVPLRNDFETDAEHPDIDRVRPGPLTLEQYAWARGAALVSFTAGHFSANRYGASLGVGRPELEGRLLFDAQADFTGFLAFTDSGTIYSNPEVWTGFVGVTYRPGALDFAVRARAARFLYGDQGVELEVGRTLGDLDVRFFAQSIEGERVLGARLGIPLPPAHRPARRALRILPVEQMTFDYRDELAPIGRSVKDVASREEFLRQLDASSLQANRRRLEPPRPPSDDLATSVSLNGVTGFILTPWCQAMADRHVQAGYASVSKHAAYDHRGLHRNDVYYAALGFLPRLEVDLRWSVIPGLKSFQDLVPDSRLTDSDRMFGARLELLHPGRLHPGLAIGVEDAVGTRRFHSSYAVSGMPFSIRSLRGRAAVGYAPRVFEAARHTLDGAFGALEVSPWRPVALAVEHDSEKVNASIHARLWGGARVRGALLDLEHPAFGAGWIWNL